MNETSPPDSSREGRLANLQNITFGDDDDDIPFDFGPPTPPAATPAEPPAQISTSTNLAAVAIVEPLTTEQRDAATIIDKDVLILAGPGTGKTKSLTSRLAYLIAGEYARPDQILAVTFTNKAAGEMAKRASALSGVSKDQLTIGTFHSICAKIIRTWPSEVGVSTKFTILDDDDQSRLIKRLLLEAHYPVSGRKKRDENTLDVEPVKAGVITSIISAWKDDGMTADAAAKLPWNPLKARRDENEHHFQVAQVIYPLYNAALREQDALDFGDLLLETVLMFEKNEQIAEAYRSQFTHVLVDEYQDTNKVQNRWLDQVAKNAVLACVGDDDQNIYSFRGADLQSMLDFPKRRPGSRIVRLTQNFRSTGAIVSAASRLIANNQTRYQKNLWTPTHGGQRLKAATFSHPGEEAQAIVRKLSQLHHEGSAWSEMAVLVRAAWTGIEIEQELLRNKIPYVLSGKTRFLDKQEVKDALAYLRLAIKNEDDLAFERAISRPKRGFGEARIEALRAFAKQNRTPMLFAWGKFGIEAAIGKAAYQKLAEFNDCIMRARQRLEQRDPLNEVIYSLLNNVGYIEMLQDEDDGAESARMPQIMTLCSLASDFQTAESFLEHIQLATDLGRGYDQDAVRLSTIHAAKGLEFETCFLAAWEEGIMPSAGATTPAQCEEERRLAFVALTRPKLRTYLSWCRMRAGRPQSPSRFFGELPEIEWKQF